MRVCVCFTIQKVVNSFFFDASGRVCLGKGVLNFVQTYSTVQGLVILSKWIERVWRKILSKFKVRLGWLLHAFFHFMHSFQWIDNFLSSQWFYFNYRDDLYFICTNYLTRFFTFSKKPDYMLQNARAVSKWSIVMNFLVS